MLMHCRAFAGQGFHYSVPSRANSNQLYVKELDRIVRLRASHSVAGFVTLASQVLKENTSSREFNDQSQARALVSG